MHYGSPDASGCRPLPDIWTRDSPLTIYFISIFSILKYTILCATHSTTKPRRKGAISLLFTDIPFQMDRAERLILNAYGNASLS